MKDKLTESKSKEKKVLSKEERDKAINEKLSDHYKLISDLWEFIKKGNPDQDIFWSTLHRLIVQCYAFLGSFTHIDPDMRFKWRDKMLEVQDIIFCTHPQVK